LAIEQQQEREKILTLQRQSQPIAGCIPGTECWNNGPIHQAWLNALREQAKTHCLNPEQITNDDNTNGPTHLLQLEQACLARKQAEEQRNQEVRRQADQQKADAEEAVKKKLEFREFVKSKTTELGYELMSSNDFILDGKKLASKNSKVAIEGLFKPSDGLESGSLYALNDANVVAAVIGLSQAITDQKNAIPLYVGDANRDTRKYILEKCDRICYMVALGTASMCHHSGMNEEYPCVVVENNIRQPD
jgi:ADP-ribose pyrophosphatase YjhB (NUDIX family)